MPESPAYAVARLDQHDACVTWIDRAEIFRQRDFGQFGDGASKFHAGGASADNGESQQPAPFVRVLFGLGVLERDQDAAADRGCILDLL